MTPKSTTEVEESVAMRVAVLAALVFAAIAVMREGVGGPSLWLAVLVGYPTVFALAYLARHRRPAMLRILVNALALVVVLGFVSAFTAAGSIADLQLPLAEVFLWLLLVQGFETTHRRGLMVSLLASLVLVAIAGVFSISMAIAPPLAGWALASLCALVLAHRAELARLPRIGPRPDPRRDVPRGIAVGAALLAVVVLVGTGVFMLVPVAGTNRALTFPAQLPSGSQAVPVLGGISNPSLGNADPSAPTRSRRSSGGRASFGYFGFSDRLDTAVRGRPDNTLVMRVRASAPDFWRGQTFDQWNGRVWRATETRVRPLQGGQPITVPRVEDDGPPFGIAATDDLIQTYYVEQSGPNAIFAAATPTSVYFPDRTIFQVPDGSLRAGVQLERDSVYTVVSRRVLATEAVLRTSGGITTVPDEIRARYAQPPTTTDRVRRLAASVTATAPTPYDKVRALEAWMGRHTRYTLDIPPLPRGRDAVDQFLFVDRSGFCEQIGTSLVVMLRSLGIPARLVVGYATGERNPFTGLYEVRAKDAHAWAEVYFPGVGWQGFDPTAQVPLAGDSSIDAAGSGALAYLEAHVSVPGWLGPIVAALAAVAVVMLALRTLVRRRRARTIPLTSWSATRAARLERLGSRRGRPRAPGETLPRYAAALGADPSLDDATRAALADAAAVVDRAMFGPRPPGPTERTRVDALLDRLANEWTEHRRPADLLPVGASDSR